MGPTPSPGVMGSGMPTGMCQGSGASGAMGRERLFFGTSVAAAPPAAVLGAAALSPISPERQALLSALSSAAQAAPTKTFFTSNAPSRLAELAGHGHAPPHAKRLARQDQSGRSLTPLVLCARHQRDHPLHHLARIAA